MHIIRCTFAMAGLVLGTCGLLFAQSAPKFNDLSSKDSAQLNRQRAVISSAVKDRYAAVLRKDKSDLTVLQKLIDDKLFNGSQTYELQCLGVAFGDVLASELPLHWVMITDEYGTDPTLRYKATGINVNALTMISKRIERHETVDLAELLRTTREQLSRIDAKIR